MAEPIAESPKVVNSELRQKSFSHNKQEGYTIKRAEQRTVETLALCEALGDWTNRLLLSKDDNSSVRIRGSEGFLEDVSNGVVLCQILQRLGIPVEKPHNPPKNEFQAKENCQKFRNACVRAKFLSIPALDADPAVGLLPTLIECAAIYQAQSKRQNIEADMPDALTKRTADVTVSSAIKDAKDGKTIPQDSETPKFDEVPPIIQSAEKDIPKSEASVQKQEKEVPTTAVSEAKPRVTSAQHTSTGGRDNRARTVSKETTEGLIARTDRTRTSSKEEVARSRRARTTSEISKTEKDQIVNYFIAGVVILLFVIYTFS
jgi:hypothetical protein